jgi:hypothetical protein
MFQFLNRTVYSLGRVNNSSVLLSEDTPPPAAAFLAASFKALAPFSLVFLTI